MAEAVVASLEHRLVEQVDDLLETLQDEEWADKEEGYKPVSQQQQRLARTVKLRLWSFKYCRISGNIIASLRQLFEQ